MPVRHCHRTPDCKEAQYSQEALQHHVGTLLDHHSATWPCSICSTSSSEPIHKALLRDAQHSFVQLIQMVAWS